MITESAYLKMAYGWTAGVHNIFPITLCECQ